MSIEALFTRYGEPSREADMHLYCHLMRADQLNTPERITYYDKYAADRIAELSRIVDDLKEYRQSLAARYGELETMPYKRLLKLSRYRPWSDAKVKYTVSIVRTYADGTTVDELSETYPGTDRRKAFTRFDELKAKYPGIDTEKDIDKKPWEK